MKKAGMAAEGEILCGCPGSFSVNHINSYEESGCSNRPHIGEAGRNCRTAAQSLKNEIGFQGQGLIAPVVSEGVVALFGRIREGKAECTPSFSS